MAKKATDTIKTSATEQVTAHIQQLDPVVGAIVQALRELILATDPAIGEQIKWNNPSFYYTGEMKPFDPKEYKRDIAVFNLHKGRIMLVFPTGATADDPTGLLTGNFKDGRRIMVLSNIDDVPARAAALQAVIKSWLSRVD